MQDVIMTELQQFLVFGISHKNTLKMTDVDFRNMTIHITFYNKKDIFIKWYSRLVMRWPRILLI